MLVQELIHLLEGLPKNMEVCLATHKHETVALCDVRDEVTRAGTIVLLSGPGIWSAQPTTRC